jgi:hypothetical protein
MVANLDRTAIVIGLELGIPAGATEEERGFNDEQIDAIAKAAVTNDEDELVGIVAELWNLHVAGTMTRMVLDGRLRVARHPSGQLIFNAAELGRDHGNNE